MEWGLDIGIGQNKLADGGLPWMMDADPVISPAWRRRLQIYRYEARPFTNVSLAEGNQLVRLIHLHHLVIPSPIDTNSARGQL